MIGQSPTVWLNILTIFSDTLSAKITSGCSFNDSILEASLFHLYHHLEGAVQGYLFACFFDLSDLCHFLGANFCCFIIYQRF